MTLNKTIVKELEKIDGMKQKAADVAADIQKQIEEKEDGIKQLSAEQATHLKSGDVIGAMKVRQEIDKLNSEIIELSKSQHEYEDVVKESAKAAFKEVFPVMKQYKLEMEAEIEAQYKEYQNDLYAVHKKHTESLHKILEKFNSVRERWIKLSTSMGLNILPATARGEEKYECLSVYRLTYTLLDNSKFNSSLNKLKPLIIDVTNDRRWNKYR